MSHIISDVLSNVNFTSDNNLSNIKVKLIIAEVYGEKLSYDINKTDFMECLILWNLGMMNFKSQFDLLYFL